MLVTHYWTVNATGNVTVLCCVCGSAGIMMFISWGFLLPVGVLTARYTKDFPGKQVSGSVCGGEVWRVSACQRR